MEHLRSTRAEINLDNLKIQHRCFAGGAGPRCGAHGHHQGRLLWPRRRHHDGIYDEIRSALFRRRLAQRGAGAAPLPQDGEILVLGLSPDSILHYGVENDIVQTICSLHQAEVLPPWASPPRSRSRWTPGCIAWASPPHRGEHGRGGSRSPSSPTSSSAASSATWRWGP